MIQIYFLPLRQHKKLIIKVKPFFWNGAIDNDSSNLLIEYVIAQQAYAQSPTVSSNGERYYYDDSNVALNRPTSQDFMTVPYEKFYASSVAVDGNLERRGILCILAVARNCDGCGKLYFVSILLFLLLHPFYHFVRNTD